MYRVIKVLNNNAILLSKDGIMYIGMGTGIGFGKKVNAIVQSNQINKLFENVDSQFFNKLSTSISKLDEEYYTLVNKIIKYISNSLSYPIQDTMYLALAEHISFSVTRLDKNIVVPCPMEYQIKIMYPQEYQIAQDVVKIIEKELHRKFPKSEVGLIAMHILNATLIRPKEEVLDSLQLISEIIEIIEQFFTIQLDENSIRYSRLLTHLQFLSNRIFMELEDMEFKNISHNIHLDETFKKATECVDCISYYINNAHHYILNNDEKNYLIIHIQNCIGGVTHGY